MFRPWSRSSSDLQKTMKMSHILVVIPAKRDPVWFTLHTVLIIVVRANYLLVSVQHIRHESQKSSSGLGYIMGMRDRLADTSKSTRPVFPNRRAAARYRALASIIPSRVRQIFYSGNIPRRIIFVNVSKSSDPESLNDICVAKSVTKPGIVKHRSIHMNDREISDIEIFESSRKGI
jgi:hypothetical protein